MSIKNQKQEGFTYIDVMIAIVILLVGILAMLSAITASIIQAKGQEQQVAAKQVASSTLESILSVKETDAQRLGWDKIGNVGSNPDADGVPQGIFLEGFQPVRESPGTDLIWGSADDTGNTLDGLEREIIIRDECDPERPSPNCTPPGTLAVKIRSIEVTVNYSVVGGRRQERVTTIVTSY